MGVDPQVPHNIYKKLYIAIKTPAVLLNRKTKPNITAAENQPSIKIAINYPCCYINIGLSTLIW